MKKLFLVLSVVFFMSCSNQDNQFVDEQSTVESSQDLRGDVRGKTYWFGNHKVTFRRYSKTVLVSRRGVETYSVRGRRSRKRVTISNLGTQYVDNMRRIY